MEVDSELKARGRVRIKVKVGVEASRSEGEILNTSYRQQLLGC